MQNPTGGCIRGGVLGEPMSDLQAAWVTIESIRHNLQRNICYSACLILVHAGPVSVMKLFIEERGSSKLCKSTQSTCVCVYECIVTACSVSFWATGEKCSRRLCQGMLHAVDGHENSGDAAVRLIQVQAAQALVPGHSKVFSSCTCMVLSKGLKQKIQKGAAFERLVAYPEGPSAQGMML